MTKTSGLILALTAAGLTAAAPALAQAHDYRARQAYADACTDKIHDNGTTGAILGGVAGAVIGANVAHHGGRTGGALIGAAAGAAVGTNIARSSTKRSCRGPTYRTAYRPAPSYGYAPTYGYETYGYAPTYGYEAYGYEPAYVPAPHDRGLHRGWYKHHDDWDDED